jgi:hypothetical protein
MAMSRNELRFSALRRYVQHGSMGFALLSPSYQPNSDDKIATLLWQELLSTPPAGTGVTDAEIR